MIVKKIMNLNFNSTIMSIYLWIQDSTVVYCEQEKFSEPQNLQNKN